MLTGLPESERAAFFSLLDEYFHSRPHLLPSTPLANQGTDPTQALVTINRQDLERAGQFAASPTGQKITSFAAGKVLGNNALGKAAVSSWANHHNHNAATPTPDAPSALPPPVRRGPPPPPSASSKPQVTGLQSGRSIGSIGFGSKTQAIGSVLGRKPSVSSALPTTTSTVPSQAPAPVSASYNPPPLAASSSNNVLPPPVRRAAGVGAPTASASEDPTPAPAYTETAVALEGIGSAEAMYDYGDGSDPDDLVIKEGERIILLEKISDDWWRGKKTDGSGATGIVPTTYVRTL